ncbi:MAG TPA: hypothetical protein VLA44_00600 [Clostridia bacterium]|nr:hypothetical protein [Clostridia bacterium]
MATRSRTHPSRRPSVTAADQPASGRTSQLPLVLSAIALVVAGLGLWLSVTSAGGTGCQSRAWDAVPDPADLPPGWTVATSNFFVGNLTVTLGGPLDEEGEQGGEIFATVTCYGGDATEALARSRSSDQAAGSVTADLTGLGDAGYQIDDASSGLAAMHFRRGDLLAYLVVQGEVSAEDLRATAVVFDAAMESARAGSIPTLGPVRTPDLATLAPAPSPDVSEEPVESGLPGSSDVPSGLERFLPSEAAGTAFTAESLTADDLSGSPGGRALAAGVRALGKTTADLQVAQAYDELGEVELYFLAFRLPGVDPEPFNTLILESWLVAGAEGVTTEEVELGGKRLTAVDYGADVPRAYLYTSGDVSIVIQAGDEALAEEGAAALP